MKHDGNGTTKFKYNDGHVEIFKFSKPSEGVIISHIIVPAPAPEYDVAPKQGIVKSK